MTRFMTMLALVMVTLAPRAGAATLGEAIDELTPEAAGYLAEVPAEVLEALSEVSAQGEHLAQAGDPGRAARAFGHATDRLSRANRALADATAEGALLALFLEGRIVGDGVRALAEQIDEADGRRVERSVEGWIASVTDAASEATTGDGLPPESPCTMEFGLCVVYCATLPTWWERSICMLDCEISLIGCYVRTIKGNNPPRLGTVGGGLGLP